MAATSETSIVRRSLLAIGIAVGGTALLMSACLLMTSVALDRALPASQADTLDPGGAELAEQPSPAKSDSQRGDRPRS